MLPANSAAASARACISWFRHQFLLVVIALSATAVGHGGSGGGDDDDSTDSGTPAPNLRSRGLISVKIWCLFIAFVGTFAGGVSPYFLRWNETFLVLGIQFAGGVFLATAWMHFLSDSASTFADLTSNGYPFAFMLCTAGYFATLLADLVIAEIYRRRGVSSLSQHHGAPHMPVANNGRAVAVQPHYQDEEAEGTVLKKKPQEEEEEEEDEQQFQQEPQKTNGKGKGVGESLLLILALCFHSVFEGIAIGVSKTKSDAWRALWTISLHKIFAAVAMGIALLKMIPGRPLISTLAYSFAFAVSTPVGVVIGIIIDATTEGPVADWIYAISMGFATGIFVYIAINHLLRPGLFASEKPVPLDTPFYRYILALVGAIFIAVVMTWDYD